MKRVILGILVAIFGLVGVGAVCGNGICEENESVMSCGADCESQFEECPGDSMTCPDGTVVYREASKNCDFAFCSGGSFECIDFCGDGGCQQDDCVGQEGCPCYETRESCPRDCSIEDGEVQIIESGVEENSFFEGSYIWSGLLVLGAILFAYVGLKILKWLFWTLAVLMLILAFVFWFVL